MDQEQTLRPLPNPAPSRSRTGPASLTRPGPSLDGLLSVPEEDVWLENQQNEHTRRTYRHDLGEFKAFYGIRHREELRKVGCLAVIEWRRHLEREGVKPRSIGRKLGALSSFCAHLVERQVLPFNPCRDIKRPRINRRRGTTPAFSRCEARAMLDAPDPSTLTGLRDRAILGVGFYAGPRRSSIVKLKVRDFHRSAGYDSLRFQVKGGTDHVVVLHPEAVRRISEYLDVSGHEADLDGALFRDTRIYARRWGRHLCPDHVWRLVKRCARQLGFGRHYGAHSMRATFITTALDCGATLERVQEAAGHADPKSTMSYDRRGFSPEHAASLKVSY